MSERKTISLRMRPADLALLDSLADLYGLTRGQMVEAMARGEARERYGGFTSVVPEKLAAALGAEERGR